MNVKSKTAALLATSAMLLAPTAALAEGPTYAPEKPAHPTHPTPGPKASLPEKAKAYGVYCRGYSKKHVKGQKMTPFSKCVTAMAKAATTKTTAKAACKGLSKEHVKGQEGTEFSRCVVAAAKAKKQAAAS
jgi:hypothetical protein